MSTVPHTLEPVHFSPQTVYCGDCLDILSCFPANCVDLICIDSPRRAKIKRGLTCLVSLFH